MTYVLAIVKLIFLIFTAFVVKNKEKKQLKKEAISELSKGIKERDVAKITSAYNKMRRM